MSKPTCIWVLRTGSYCGKPVCWTMEWDGSTKARKYAHFCSDHTREPTLKKWTLRWLVVFGFVPHTGRYHFDAPSRVLAEMHAHAWLKRWIDAEGRPDIDKVDYVKTEVVEA